MNTHPSISRFACFNAVFKKCFREYAFIILAILLIVIFFSPVIGADRTFYFRDIHTWFYPLKFYLAKTLSSGSLPFWCPHYFCGAPFLSDLQTGVFYPPSILLVLFPFPEAFNVYILFHFFIGFVFCHLFIRGLGLSKQAANFASVAFCFGGYAIATLNTVNNLSTLVWIPATLWSFQRVERRKPLTSYFLSIFFISMTILGGEPQVFILGAVINGLYGGVILPLASNGTLYQFKKAIGIIILYGLAVLLTMIQLGPTYIDYQNSVRKGGMSYEDASEHSMPPSAMWHLILPRRFTGDLMTSPTIIKDFFSEENEIPWLLTIYPGGMVTLFAVFCLLTGLKQPYTYLGLALFGLAILTSMGDKGPVFYWIYKIMPVFRFPVKFMFVAGFILIVASAYGFDRFFRHPHITRKVLLGNLVIGVLVLDLFVNHFNLNPTCPASFYTSRDGLLTTGLERGTEFYRIYRDRDFKLPTHVKITLKNWQILKKSTLAPHLGILYGEDHVDGMTGLELLYQYLMTEILEKPWPEKIRFLKLANVKYIFTSEKLENLPEIKEDIVPVKPLVYQIKDFLPRAWVVGNVVPLEAFSLDTIIEPGFDYDKSAWINNLPEKPLGLKGHKVQYKLHSLEYVRNNRIQIQLTLNERGLLCLSESGYHGWKVYVDGEEQDVLALNLFYQGVCLPKGWHRVEFVFTPQYFYLFVGGSVTTFVFLVGVALFFRIQSNIKRAGIKSG